MNKMRNGVSLYEIKKDDARAKVGVNQFDGTHLEIVFQQVSLVFSPRPSMEGMFQLLLLNTSKATVIFTMSNIQNIMTAYRSSINLFGQPEINQFTEGNYKGY